MAPPTSHEDTARPWHLVDRVDLETALHTSAGGLDPAEVEARLARYGPNQLKGAPAPSMLATVLNQFKSPLIYILLIATVVTFAIGEYIDAGVIAVTLVLNAVIGFTQERRAEMSVRALSRLVSPRARVIRGGREHEVDSRHLVPGDLVLLETGVRVPADLRLIASTALLADESLLTGESVPVAKTTAPLADAERALADRTNMAYAGTTVASGRARGYTVATGAATALGAIAARVREEQPAETPLQHRMTRFARVVGIVVGLGAVLAFGVGVARGEGAAAMFLFAVAMAVSAVPEGLPVAFTITLALGVHRMARRHAIVRRLPAVETLGSTTVIGSDKTGTLTENRMTVQKVWAAGRTLTLRDASAGSGALLEGEPLVALAEHRAFYLTLLTGVLTNEAQIVPTDGGWEMHGDPTEGALLVAAAQLGVDPGEARDAYALFAEIPFEPERQYSAAIRTHHGEHLVFVKGAPERVLAMSTEMLADDGPVALDRAAALAAARELASEGLRVLGMAYGVLPEPPSGPEHVSEPHGLVFLGLQGSIDPPRAGVRDAIAGCQEAGIRVVMITGDHAATARAIGRELGIVASDDAPVLTGAELGQMDDARLRACCREVAIYARVAPEQKLRVVRALESHGEVVAVTGDGVNDAPALKAAAIGVAMGKSGTDVAREAADMVLADDNFVSIYAAVEEGRITFDNLRKVTFFLISTGAAELVAILTALLLRWPLPFLPAQILWLNLVTNGLQDMALAFEPGEAGVRKRRPRDPREGIVSALLWERTVVAGVVMAAGTLATFSLELARTGDLGRAQTIALTTMVLFQVFQAGNSRSESRSLFRLSPISNPFLFVSTAAALGAHVAAMYLPWGQLVLRFEPIGLHAWIEIGLVAATILVAMELHKWLRRAAAPGRF